LDFAPWAEYLAGWARARRLNVVLADSIASTNRLGLDIVRSLPERELVGWIFALHQRRGRGRFDRTWSSPRGVGVYASRMLRLPSAAARLLPLAIGVGLCEGLAAVGYPCRLKWPNDLLLDGAKVGGILLHGRPGADRTAVVAGFGVNHSHGERQLPRTDLTSLRLAAGGPPPPLTDLSARLADAVDEELRRWGEVEAWSAPSLVARYITWSAHAPGDPLMVTEGADGLRGRFAGFTTDGRLRLDTGSGERLVAAADVAEVPR
jgi:biotin-[acetyl-CoA-carboxylase] ligase BirA-like protein